MDVQQARATGDRGQEDAVDEPFLVGRDGYSAVGEVGGLQDGLESEMAR